MKKFSILFVLVLFGLSSLITVSVEAGTTTTTTSTTTIQEVDDILIISVDPSSRNISAGTLETITLHVRNKSNMTLEAYNVTLSSSQYFYNGTDNVTSLTWPGSGTNKSVSIIPEQNGTIIATISSGSLTSAQETFNVLGSVINRSAISPSLRENLTSNQSYSVMVPVRCRTGPADYGAQINITGSTYSVATIVGSNISGTSNGYVIYNLTVRSTATGKLNLTVISGLCGTPSTRYNATFINAYGVVTTTTTTTSTTSTSTTSTTTTLPAGETTCNSCDDCNAKLNGSYSVVKLTADITDQSGTCIEFNTNNTEFDCQGHMIDGDSSGIDHGIYIGDFNNTGGGSNNTVKNCVVTQFSEGIRVYSDNNTLYNNTISNNKKGIYIGVSNYNILISNNVSSNSHMGIHIHDSSNNTIINNTASNNAKGIYLYYSCNYNTLINNTASNNNVGVTIRSSHNNTLTNNIAPDNKYGIVFYTSSYNTLTNNTANSNTYDGIEFYDSSSNTLNSNHVCSSANSDFYLSNSPANSGTANYCDNPGGWNDTGASGCTYQCSEVTTTTTIPAGETTCNSCSDCNAKLNGDYAIVNLTADITDHSGGCITFGASNVELDCQRHTIDEDGSGYDNKGIYMYKKYNNTAKNCVITDFTHGISLLMSSHNTLTNNTVANNTNGIHFYQSSHNTIANNTLNSNTDGISIAYSSINNTLSNNDLRNNNNYSLFVSSCNNSIDTTNIGGHDGKPILYYHDTSGIKIANTSAYSEILLCRVNNSLIDNVTINNGNLRSDGLLLYESDNNTIRNSNLSSNSIGINLHRNSANNTLTNNTVSSNNWSGIFIHYDSDGNSITGNTAESNNRYGIHLWYGSDSNTLNSNHVCSNAKSDFYVQSGSGNTGTDNYCDNPDGWNDDGVTGCKYNCVGETTTTTSTSTTSTTIVINPKIGTS